MKKAGVRQHLGNYFLSRKTPSMCKGLHIAGSVGSEWEPGVVRDGAAPEGWSVCLVYKSPAIRNHYWDFSPQSSRSHGWSLRGSMACSFLP